MLCGGLALTPVTCRDQQCLFNPLPFTSGHVPARNMLQDIIVGRGPSGGLALWGRGDADWLASSGVLQVYK
jgi:hypothetical protein